MRSGWLLAIEKEPRVDEVVEEKVMAESSFRVGSQRLDIVFHEPGKWLRTEV